MDHGEEQRNKETYLHLNIQNTYPPLLGNALNSLHARAVIVAAELCVLDESVLRHQFQEGFFRREVVILSVLFAGSGCACRVF